MWTQWRKLKLFSHLTTHKAFLNEFGELLKLIEDGRGALLHLGATEKHERSEKNSEREKQNDKIIKL